MLLVGTTTTRALITPGVHVVIGGAASDLGVEIVRQLLTRSERGDECRIDAITAVTTEPLVDLDDDGVLGIVPRLKDMKQAPRMRLCSLEWYDDHDGPKFEHVVTTVPNEKNWTLAEPSKFMHTLRYAWDDPRGLEPVAPIDKSDAAAAVLSSY